MSGETRKSKVQLEVEATGAKEAAGALGDIGKGATSLQKELASLSRASDLENIGKEMGQVARETGDTGKAVADLTDKLKELGATSDEIKGVARSFESARTASDSAGGGGGNAPAAAKFRGIASLVGGSDAGNLVGIVDDIQDAFEGVGQLKGAFGGLTGAAKTAAAADTALSAAQAASGTAAAAAGVETTGAAVGFGAVAASLLPLAPILLPLAAAAVAVGAAVKGAVDEIHERLDQLNREQDARRSAVEAAFSGTTVGEAKQKIDEYNNSIAANTKLLNEAKQGQDAAFAKDKARYEGMLGIFSGFGDFFARIAQLFGVSEANTYADDISKSNDALKTATAGQKEWQGAIDEGLFKTGEAAKSETTLSSARSETTDSTQQAAKAQADAAKQVQAAQEKAHAAASASAQKAAQNIQQNSEKAAAAQDQYGKTIRSATTSYKNAVADIGTKRSQAEFDIRIDQGRDLDDIQLKNTQEVTKAIAEDWRDARNAALHDRDEIADIRRQGREAELEAARDQDFKQQFLAREETASRLAEEARSEEREARDRANHLMDVKDDLSTSLRQESDLRRTAGIRAFDDLKTSTARELDAARTAKQRNFALAAEARNSEYAQLAGHLGRLSGLYQQHFAGVERMAGGLSGGRSAGIPARMISGTGIGVGPLMQQIIQR